MTFDNINIDPVILNALREDMMLGDITTDSLIDAHSASRAILIAKQAGIVAGLGVCRRVFELMDESVMFKQNVEDGAHVEKGCQIAQIEGATRALLKAERTALNFLQRMSGIATRTGEFCKRVEGLPVKIVDTRKTAPGLRFLDKYAVRAGGGHNHRFSLSDGVLIKDNHIQAAGSIRRAIEAVRERVPHTVKIEIEVETIEEVKEALDCAVDAILLDNMSIEMMREAVELINRRALVEASGNINLDTVYDVACTGVDIISVGELTHSVKAFDISMRIV